MMRPAVAAEFSFLMSVIAISGAAVRMLPELSGVPAAASVPLAVGGGVALVSGVAAIWAFVRLLRHGGFHLSLRVVFQQPQDLDPLAIGSTRVRPQRVATSSRCRGDAA